MFLKERGVTIPFHFPAGWTAELEDSFLTNLGVEYSRGIGQREPDSLAPSTIPVLDFYMREKSISHLSH